MNAKYYGIAIEEDKKQNCWFVFNLHSGDEVSFDSKPTETEIDSLVNSWIKQ